MIADDNKGNKKYLYLRKNWGGLFCFEIFDEDLNRGFDRFG